VRLLCAARAAGARLDRLWPLALDPDSPAQAAARRALAGASDRAAVDRRAVAEMEAALATGDVPRLRAAAEVGVRRRFVHALSWARRLFRGAPRPAAFEALVACGLGLRAADRLSDAWLEAALERPESPWFDVAACLLGRRPPPGWCARLERALSSTARGGEPAAFAAHLLLALGGGPPPGDLRYLELLGRCAPPARASLAGALVTRGAPFAPLRPHLVELLGSREPLVVELMTNLLPHLDDREHEAALRQALPSVVDDGLRDAVERRLMALAGGTFWQAADA
jgi:hypothetical protein